MTTTLKWKTKLFRLPSEIARELERAAFESRVNQTTYLIPAITETLQESQMTKTDISIDLAELATILHLAGVGVDKGYLSAAIGYLDDIESEAIGLRKAIEDLRGVAESPLAARHYLHPNDPAFVPPTE